MEIRKRVKIEIKGKIKRQEIETTRLDKTERKTMEDQVTLNLKIKVD